MGSEGPARGDSAAGAAIDSVGEATLELFAANDAYNRLLYSRLRAMAAPRGRVLEVGCGIGNLTRLILKEPGVTAVHAIDLDAAYVERVLRALDDSRLTASASRLEEFLAGAQPAAQDSSYDAIVCSNVLEHIENDVAAMRNCARLLRSGGLALILVPAHHWLFCELDRGLSHYRRYSRAELSELARASGLELRRGRYFNPLGVLGWWLNGKLLRRAALPARQLRLYSRLAIGLSSFLDRINIFPLGISVLALMRKH
jgi:SAM-dependent methyltransferase